MYELCASTRTGKRAQNLVAAVLPCCHTNSALLTKTLPEWLMFLIGLTASNGPFEVHMRAFDSSLVRAVVALAHTGDRRMRR